MLISDRGQNMNHYYPLYLINSSMYFATGFDNWDRIVNNLTDERVSAIDARRLSLGELYLAKNIDWCLSLNDQLRRKEKRVAEPLWPKEKFDNIFQNIIQSGIFEDIQHSPSVAASLGGRLQNAMVAYCRQRYQPY